MLLQRLVNYAMQATTAIHGPFAWYTLFQQQHLTNMPKVVMQG